jgi:CBS domain-containing protein
MKGKVVCGMISRTDIDRLTFGALFENEEGADESVLDMFNIQQIMTSKPRTISSEDSIRDVAAIFTKEEYHALPVVDNGELKGIVTTTDVIAHMLEQY